ncbi:MAG: hypothetical protein MUD01_14890 [Chloroflexaceae bacterium]|jgi:hypothetical protein|nr:hypothetical protein [Chloroflexaceae bacterium]
MLTYDDLVTELEEGWLAAGLHEHAVIESVVPSSHDRSYKAELFPEHPEPLTEDTMPPWAELNFIWTAMHQLRAEGREIAAEPVDLSWTYTVNVRGMNERNDHELVRMFQKAVQSGFQRIYPLEADEMEPVAVEVRRIYQGDRQNLNQVYLQLVSINLTDLSDQWNDRDPRALRVVIRAEVQLAAAIIQALSETFTPTGRGSYRTVDAA